MHNLHLPLPVVSQAYQVSPNEYLAPLRSDPCVYRVTQTAGMQRQHSVSSATDSGRSTYYGSCSDSPVMTPCASPQFMTTTPRKRRSQTSSTSSKSSCASNATQQNSTGKAPRAKRQDRYLFSKLGSAGAAKIPAARKDQGEAGSRFDLTGMLGMKQNQLLRMVPDLPDRARVGIGRTRPGWKLLNRNNISPDLLKPLQYNKQDIHASEIQVTEDDEELFDNIESECKAHEQEAGALARSNPSYDSLMDFVRRTSQTNRAGRISSSRRRRGTHDFQPPFC
ncbi:hypothetical protein BDU57DRAFT_526677 [Ampelomyces quisqualis]|uniref:Uncharacterized protein n=1 Tax=Ampelomyces quisqualis TaxID=50730 RepID=A0A6A5R3H5_AMPQU|nr:hypothetical protein BDU57DRAFT_526677 [Ampelomyces quisqualis]